VLLVYIPSALPAYAATSGCRCSWGIYTPATSDRTQPYIALEPVRYLYTQIGQPPLRGIKKLSLRSKIYGRISASTPGRVWTPGDFADFGSQDAVIKTLQRLAATGRLRHVSYGLYDRPRVNRLTGQPATVDYRAVIDAITRRENARILVDGMTAANDLGLSDAVPGRVVMHSDTRLRPVQVGKLTVTFRLTSPNKLYWAGHPAMRIVQALHWLKPKLEDPKEKQIITSRLHHLLSEAKRGPALRRDLIEGLARLPAWTQDFLRDLLATPRVGSSRSVKKVAPTPPRRRVVRKRPSKR
jgi:hypothetical protein